MVNGNGQNLHQIVRKRGTCIQVRVPNSRFTVHACSIRARSILDEIPCEADNGMRFMIMCLVVRACESIGVAAYLTAVLAIIASEFRDCVTTAFVRVLLSTLYSHSLCASSYLSANLQCSVHLNYLRTCASAESGGDVPRRGLRARRSARRPPLSGAPMPFHRHMR